MEIKFNGTPGEVLLEVSDFLELEAPKQNLTPAAAKAVAEVVIDTVKKEAKAKIEKQAAKKEAPAPAPKKEEPKPAEADMKQTPAPAPKKEEPKQAEEKNRLYDLMQKQTAEQFQQKRKFHRRTSAPCAPLTARRCPTARPASSSGSRTRASKRYPTSRRRTCLNSKPW